MTNKNILAIIKENNENNEIKWKVEKNTQKEIIIKNNYLDGVSFSIIFVTDYDGDNYIKVIDETMKKTVTLLLQGQEFYCDFENKDVGISQAILAIVKYFYYVY